jgi:hypothetical protein
VKTHGLRDRIAFRVYPEQLNKVNNFCEYANMTQAELMRSLIENLKIEDDRGRHTLSKGRPGDNQVKTHNIRVGGLY